MNIVNGRHTHNIRLRYRPKSKSPNDEVPLDENGGTRVDQSKILIRSTKSQLNRGEMRFNPRVRTIKIQKDGKLQVHFIGKGERCAGRGNGEMGYNQQERRGGVADERGERDEPPFINLDRLLNPGFDETPGWEDTYTYVTARR